MNLNYIWELIYEIWRLRSSTLYQLQVEEQSESQYVRTMDSSVAGLQQCWAEVRLG